MVSPTSLAILVILFANCVLGLPAKENENLPAAGNLKLTFKSADEIPAGFFESSAPNATARREDRRIEYPACKDGSGGLCVGAGKCPVGFKVESTNALACKSNQECCYKTPDDDKSCRNRGGECVARRRCGSAPTDKQATDCNATNGEVCCIFV